MDQHEPVRRGFAVAAACALAVTLLAAWLSAGSAPPAATARIATVPTAPALGGGPGGHGPLLQPRTGPDHRAGRAARPGPGRRLRPRRLVGLGQLRHRRLHHQQHRPGPGRPGIRRRQPRLPPRANASQWPDQIVDVKCAIRYLRANARAAATSTPRDRGLGPERRRAPRRAARHRWAARPAGTSAPTPTCRAACRRWSTWPGRATCSPWATRATPCWWPESFTALLGRVPRDQLGADLKAASPVTYVAPGDPPFLILDVEQRRDRLPPAVQGAGLGPRGERRTAPAGPWCRQGGHAFDTVGEVPVGDRRSSRLVVDFFVPAPWPSSTAVHRAT